MKETDLRSKTCVVPVAIAAGLGMAGMGLVSEGMAMADTTSVTDTLSVNVLLSCTFSGTGNKTYTGSADNGTEVNDFDDSGVHEFNLFCNDRNGYTVTATPYDLKATGIDEVISYTDNYTHTGTSGMWTAAIASNTEGVTATPVVPAGGGTIISADSNTPAGGTTFTATYNAYVGTDTPAGTYAGTIVYTLIASGASSNGNATQADVGDSEDDDENSGTESGNSGTGGSSTDGANSNEANVDVDSGKSANGTQSASSPTLNNTYNTYTYNTYSTTNTYNTTNYPTSSGVSVPVATNMQAVMSENENTGTTSNDDDGAEADDNYEKPLGVTTSTSSSNENSGVDPMPLVAAAGALAIAGVVAVAIARSEKKEDD